MRSTLFALSLLAAILLGVFLGGFVLFHVGPQLQCAADVECGRMGDRWWHTPLMLGAAVAPVAITLLAWRRFARRAI